VLLQEQTILGTPFSCVSKLRIWNKEQDTDTTTLMARELKVQACHTNG
jgi:hypothetical protein